MKKVKKIFIQAITPAKKEKAKKEENSQEIGIEGYKKGRKIAKKRRKIFKDIVVARSPTVRKVVRSVKNVEPNHTLFLSFQ